MSLYGTPGEGKGYPLQDSGLENSMDCMVHGLTEWDTTKWLSLSLGLNSSRPELSGMYSVNQLCNSEFTSLSDNSFST